MQIKVNLIVIAYLEQATILAILATYRRPSLSKLLLWNRHH
ncbi:hypothetical protein THOB06_10344 [Vibrio rotiferianus]|nr:hypothetical protein THOG10_10344 [Vibrio rotiferianus]CAH1557213.1 hypothetical protein THOB06_10344 [Vibrio rotiferianus]